MDLQLDNLGLLLVEQMATWSDMVCLSRNSWEKDILGIFVVCATTLFLSLA